jgi:hypothetical protein
MLGLSSIKIKKVFSMNETIKEAEPNLEGIAGQGKSSISDTNSSSHWIYANIIGLKWKGTVGFQKEDEENKEEDKVTVNFITFDGIEIKLDIPFPYYINNVSTLFVNSVVQISGISEQNEWKTTGIITDFSEIIPISDKMTYEKVEKEQKEIIDEIKELEEGWDSRDAKPVKNETIEDTKMFISALMCRANKKGLKIDELIVTPGYDGSIGIESENDDELDIFVQIPEGDKEMTVIVEGKNIRKIFGMKKMEFDDGIVKTIEEILQ